MGFPSRSANTRSTEPHEFKEPRYKYDVASLDALICVCGKAMATHNIPSDHTPISVADFETEHDERRKAKAKLHHMLEQDKQDRAYEALEAAIEEARK